MSVGAISGNGTGSVNSSTSQSQNTGADPATTFANWLSTVQNAGVISSQDGGSTSGFVNPNPTAAFAAHLSNGLTIGLVALGPVDAAGEQAMAASVEQAAEDFGKISIPTTMASASTMASDSSTDSSSSSSTAGNGSSTPPAPGGGIGMYTAMPDGTEFMAWTAGTANGGPSVQNMTDGMNYAVTTFEKTLGDGVGTSS